MSLAQIQDQAACLGKEERRKLIAFLVSLQTEDDEEFKTRLARKIDDNDPSHWVELDELEQRFSK